MVGLNGARSHGVVGSPISTQALIWPIWPIFSLGVIRDSRSETRLLIGADGSL